MTFPALVAQCDRCGQRYVLPVMGTGSEIAALAKIRNAGWKLNEDPGAEPELCDDCVQEQIARN